MVCPNPCPRPPDVLRLTTTRQRMSEGPLTTTMNYYYRCVCNVQVSVFSASSAAAAGGLSFKPPDGIQTNTNIQNSNKLYGYLQLLYLYVASRGNTTATNSEIRNLDPRIQRAHTYIHKCIHTYIHTYIHTHIHAYKTCILATASVGVQQQQQQQCSY